jgi:hypothetical protein
MMALVSTSYTAFAPACAPRASVTMMDKAELKALASDLNPVVGYWDPLRLSDGNFWDSGNEATIGFLREAEIKHVRVAMAGFVGYLVHANDLRFPWDKIAQSVPTGLGPEATWDAIPFAAKSQIILFVGILEFWRENKFILEGDGAKHYMRGGKPGYFPSFNLLPHPVPFPLFDPFEFQKGWSAEKKARGLVVETNNGRLAMIGLMGFLAEDKVPGSVPALGKIGLKAYTGQVMSPFTCLGADCNVGGIPYEPVTDWGF